MAKICEFARRCKYPNCHHKIVHSGCMFQWHDCSIEKITYEIGKSNRNTCKCIEVTYIR